MVRMNNNNKKKDTLMKIKAYLCATACSVVFLTGCSDKGERPQISTDEGTTPPTLGNDTPSSIDDLLTQDGDTPASSTNDSSTPMNAKVFIYNNLLPDQSTAVDFTDSTNFMTLESYLHWAENQKILKIPGSAPASVKTTQNILTIPDATATIPVIMDVWGDSPTQKEKFQLSRSATFSVIDLKDSDLKILPNNTLTAMALRLENSNFSISSQAKLTTHALYVGANSSIQNGENIVYTPNNFEQFGITLNQLKVQKHKRFPWATEGEFMIAGKIDHLTVTPGLKLYTQGRTANIRILNHQGGTIELTSSAPFETTSYTVNAGNNSIRVIWDTASKTPLMRSNYVQMNNDVSVVLSALDSTIETGDHIILIETKNGTLNRFNKGIQTFAATFDLATKTDEATKALQLTLTLTEKGLSAQGLSHTETAIAHQLLQHDAVAGNLRTALLNKDGVNAALREITTGQHLTPIQTSPLSFDGLRYLDPKHANTGVIQTVNQTGTMTETTYGMNVTPQTQVGVSLTHPSFMGNSASNVWALHGQSQHLGIDGFISADGKLHGAAAGLYHGNAEDGYAAVTLSTMHHKRSGLGDSILGRIDAAELNETHVFANATLKKRIANIDISAQLFSSVYAKRDAHVLKINNKNIDIPLQTLPLTYGVQMQTSFNVNVGTLTAGYGISKDLTGYVQSLNLMFDIQL